MIIIVMVRMLLLLLLLLLFLLLLLLFIECYLSFTVLGLHVHDVMEPSEQSFEEGSVTLPVTQRTPRIREARGLLKVTQQLRAGHGAHPASLTSGVLSDTESPSSVSS